MGIGTLDSSRNPPTASAPAEAPQLMAPQRLQSALELPPPSSTTPSLLSSPSSSTLPASELVPCPICFDEFSPDDAVGARGCTHRACRDCTSSYWEHSIATEGAAFPTCFSPGCHVVAATEDIVSLVGARLAARLTYLRAQTPALSLRGERLWCSANGCWEPLPPPPLWRPFRDHGGGGGGSAAAERQGGGSGVVDEMRVTCPRCATPTCRRCGEATHAGDCAVPLVSTASSAAYEAWALAEAAGACPYCGAHAVRDGGCDIVQCGWCRRSYTFRPFRNVAALRGTVAVGTVAAPPLDGDAGEHIRVGIVFLACGVGISTAPAILVLFSPGWEAYVVLVPWILAGVWVFVDGLVSVRTGVRALRAERQQQVRGQAAAGGREGGAGEQVDGRAGRGGGGGGGGGGVNSRIEATLLAIGLVMIFWGVDWGVGAILVRMYHELHLNWGIGPHLVTLFMRRGWGRRRDSLGTLIVGGVVFMVGVVTFLTGVWLAADVMTVVVADRLRRRVGGGGGRGVDGLRGAGIGGGAGDAGVHEAAAGDGTPVVRAGIPHDQATRERQGIGTNAPA